MTNNIYTIYNKKSGRYGDVMTFPTDDYAVMQISKYNGISEDEHELCRIGTIDIETGIVCSEAPVRVPFTVPKEQNISDDVINSIRALINVIKTRN